VSAGIVGGDEMLNSCYAEDSRAEVDFNVVMTRLMDLARNGIMESWAMRHGSDCNHRSGDKSAARGLSDAVSVITGSGIITPMNPVIHHEPARRSNWIMASSSAQRSRRRL
jgi:hypothetical protein